MQKLDKIQASLDQLDKHLTEVPQGNVLPAGMYMPAMDAGNLTGSLMPLAKANNIVP